MRQHILAIPLLCCVVLQADSPAFKMNLTLQSDPLPATYRIKVKLALAYEVIDIQNMIQEKRKSPVESDYVFREKSPKEYQFEITYVSGNPVFSKGHVLEFQLPGGVSETPKSLMATLSFPAEYEIYNGARLIRKSKVQFGMQVETARTKPICLRVFQGGPNSGSDVNVGIGLSECGVDFSKMKKIPR